MRILTAFCDLVHCPVSFDAVTFMVRAMLERQRRGCSGLHIVVVPNEDGLGGFARNWGGYDEAATRWRLWHIVLATCPLARATVTIAPTREIAKQMPAATQWYPDGKAHFMGPLVDAARKKEKIPRFESTDAARQYVAKWLSADPRPLVTMTTRENGPEPDRNSNMKAWEQMREHISSKGFRVEVIRDTHVELAQGRGYASLDPDLRLALYERAKMNLIGNNGPQELLKFSNAPYLVFGVALTPGWQEHFKRYFNMNPGEQLPWARPDQRLVYRPDSFEVLREEFERWESATS